MHSIDRMSQRLALGTAVAWLAGAAFGQAPVQPAPQAVQEPAWQVAGQQGLMRFVIVPTVQARNRDAYLQEIKALCQSLETCFLNFYTNTTNAPVAMPLPDAIDTQATAVYRRSAKQGTEGFQWSCRMATTDSDCF